MNTRLSALSYLLRMLEVMRVTMGALSRFLYRRFRKRPDHGPELLREFFEKLGGSFIKFGQILSLQIDTLPREYCDALLALLDRVPPFAAAEVERLFLATFHASPRDLYRTFDYQAMASASIGQVHRATLPDGT